jgi:hypothetical protein
MTASTPIRKTSTGAAPARTGTQIFLKNADILREIHNSKKTFCSFIEPQYADYDEIVTDRDMITDELIETVRQRKATPRGKPHIPIDTIAPESIVFRVMTYEHIPLDPDRPRRNRNVENNYAKTSFNPFKHYIKIDGGLREVCRSHWNGGFENGHFSADHGRVNNRLAQMLILLVERYARRPNFRGYSYLDDMCGQALVQLSQIALQFDESKSVNPFAFYTTAMHNCFVRVLNMEKRVQTIRDDLLIVAGAAPSNTRQIENELEYRFPSDGKPKRGAKKKTPDTTTT